MVKNISNYLSSIHSAIFILINIAILIVVMTVSNGFIKIFNIKVIEFYEVPHINNIDIYDIVLSILVVPLLETLIFQQFIFWISRKIGIANKSGIVILLSSTLFASTHFYSVAYIIYAMCLGVIFMYAYIIRVKKHPFWTVFGIHAIFNLIIVILQINKFI